MKLQGGSVHIEPLSARHDRKVFTCGNDSLDRYIRQQAGQDVRRGVARVYIAVFDDRPDCILGFYTLSAALVVPEELPEDAGRRLPRVPLPAALVGRLAVDRNFARRGLGSILLADAIKKALAAADIIAMTVVVVDPIDEAAHAFYSAFGFESLQGSGQRMFLMLPRHASKS